MLDALPLLIPTQQGRLVGTVHPAQGARHGLVILGDRRDPSPEWPDLYEELALYAQAAGYDVLRVEYREPEQLDTRAFDLLGAVMALRTQGAERVFVISRARTARAATPAQGERAIIPGFIKSVLRMSRSTSELTGHMAEMVGMVSDVVETISGTATIVTQTQQGRWAASHVMRQRVLDAATRGDHGQIDHGQIGHGQMMAPGVIDSRNEAGQLVLRVGEAVGLKERVMVIETLYGWLRAQSGERARRSDISGQARVTTETSEANQSLAAVSAAESRAALRAQRAWLDEQWAAVLGGLKARDPALAAALPGVSPSGEGEADAWTREARRAWRYLDAQARNEWMDACSNVVRLITLTTGTLAEGYQHPATPAIRDA